jgi:hypothetical protein
MISLRAVALRVLPASALVGTVSATTVDIPTINVNMTAAIQPILDIVTAIGPLPFVLIGLVLGMVILRVITSSGHFITKLFDRLLNMI